MSPKGNDSWHRVGVFLRITIAFLILCFPIAAEPITLAEIARKIIAPLIDPDIRTFPKMNPQQNHQK